jgi:DNA-binding winged helix-turn-helix (wHTH) protein
MIDFKMTAQLVIYSPDTLGTNNNCPVMTYLAGLGVNKRQLIPIGFGQLPNSFEHNQAVNAVPCLYLETMQGQEAFVKNFLDAVYPFKPILILAEKGPDNTLSALEHGFKPNEVIYMDGSRENALNILGYYSQPYQVPGLNSDCQNDVSICKPYFNDRAVVQLLPGYNMTSGDLHFEFDRGVVTNLEAGDTARITKSQSALIAMLLENEDRCVGRGALVDAMQSVNRSGNRPDDKVLDVQKCKVAAAIAKIQSEFKSSIQNVWGRGYVYSSTRNLPRKPGHFIGRSRPKTVGGYGAQFPRVDGQAQHLKLRIIS